MLGSPVAGTSVLAHRLATILPDLTLAEALKATRIHGIAGLTGHHTAFITTQPCHGAGPTPPASGPPPPRYQRRLQSCEGLGNAHSIPELVRGGALRDRAAVDGVQEEQQVQLFLGAQRTGDRAVAQSM
jgi:Magnesium chelatase, subunit ChlI